MEKHQIEYGDQSIVFYLERKNVKNVNLNIKPDSTIEVSAREEVPMSFIYDFVKGKAYWILKNVKKFENVKPLKQSCREYVSGESYRYLGKQYRLKVKMAIKDEEVKYFRGYIHMYVKYPTSSSNKKKLMDNWYRSKAESIFKESLERVHPIVKKYEVKKPTIELRSMKARWGSAFVDSNVIVLNKDLIKAPKHCIDYVVLHELIHFKYNNHSESFYKMLFSMMPDWEKRKAILDEEVVRDL